MPNRRSFLKKMALGVLLPFHIFSFSTSVRKAEGPLVISTWEQGLSANEAAWEVLGGGGRALDAVEAGVRIFEADPEVRTVGYGGYPDRDGFVTLDACMMDEHDHCG